MKDGIKSIIGKRISAVVVAQGDIGRSNQVFLVFTDGTRFEFYGAQFNCCAGLDEAAGIEEYVESAGGSVTKVFGVASMLEPAPAAAGGSTIEALMTRDLAAWVEVKKAILRARRPA